MSNIRHKSKPVFVKEEVSKVEQTLKDIIEYGFAENVEEELLEFNESG